jgi:hypothetical protein
MLKRLSTLLVLSLLASLGWAKDKTKNTLPPYVVQAKTVAVIIDPSAGISIDDPQANRMAQKDVEAALLKWGRFEPVEDARAADLIVVVRKGNGRLMDDPITGARGNSGGDAINPVEGGAPPGSQGNSPRGLSGGPAIGAAQQTPKSQADVLAEEDSFVVFKGGENPRYATPTWKYVSRDGLNPQTVPAIAAFKKALAAADKAAAAEKP